MRILALVVIMVLPVLLVGSGCSKDESSYVQLPEPLRPPRKEPVMVDNTQEMQPPVVPQRFQKTPGSPSPNYTQGAVAGLKKANTSSKFQQAGIMLSIESMPIPAFINEVYGNILHRSFEIAPALQKLTDLVTVRTSENLSPEEVDSLCRQVLGNYGIIVEEQGMVLRFYQALNQQQVNGEPPLLVSGRTLPEVPVTHRPVFQVVPLQVIGSAQMTQWLTSAYKDYGLVVTASKTGNSIILMGPRTLVAQAVEGVRMFDQPALTGRYSIRIEPLYIDAEELSEMLIDVLSSEGYSTSKNLSDAGKSVILLPIESVKAVIAFAPDLKTLNHIRDWVKTLDSPGQALEEDVYGIYYYPVQNTSAEDLYDVLSDVVDNLPQGGTFQKYGSGASAGGAARSARSSSAKANNKSSDPSAAKPDTKNTASKDTASKDSNSKSKSKSDDSTDEEPGNLVVDKARNAIIFQGKRSEWRQLLSVIKEMDHAARMVLIEVTIAEITLSEDEEFGVEWLLENTDLGHDFTGGDNNNSLGGTISTLNSLGIGSSGISFILDNAGSTRAILNAFASKDRVSILSTPRVMVKSGSKATIDVGSEVPTVTSQTTSNSSDTNIYQSITYRSTGVLMTVEPIVHSGQRIDLDISQEVSESQPNTDSEIDSPVIYNRTIETSLGLRDGGSVLIGGLISRTRSKGYTGVPVLSTIPVLGRLFRVDSETTDKTEMVMLIVPYIIDNDQDAVEVTNALKSRLGGIGKFLPPSDLPVKTSYGSPDTGHSGSITVQQPSSQNYKGLSN